MKLLAIDTAANLCSACVFDTESDTVLFSSSIDVGRGHAERLMGIVSETLAGAGLFYSDLGKVVATTGPGSFTGIRVGLATARGISTGLGIPIVGVTTLEAIAAKAIEQCEGTLLTVLDARREECFFQFHGYEGVSSDSNIASFKTVCDHVTGFLEKRGQNLSLCGAGANQVNDYLETNLPVVCEDAAAPIEQVARLGSMKALEFSRPEPLYLREADAKPQTGFALPRIG